MRRRPNRSPLSRISRKIRSRRQLVQTGRRLRQHGRRLVLTNGCFDVLHLGHVILLEQARRLGDVLIVALNSDRSVRSLKGPGRPLCPQRDRALLLAALESVDYVTIFSEKTPRNVIAALRPDVLVKGADWGAREIVGRDLIERDGGRVVRIPLAKGRSTSRLVARLRARR